MAVALVLVPLILAAVAALLPSDRMRPRVVALGGAVQLALAWLALRQPRVEALGGWLALEPLDRIVLGFTTVLFAACAIYVPSYLARHAELSNRLFCSSVLAFIAALTLIVESQHLALMWVAVETSTLTAAPLVYFRRHARSLEATWKYLLIGSVGIALALLGLFFLGYATLYAGGEPSLLMSDMIANARHMSRSWLHAGFVVLLVGYGTKMGLAPMHTWKPDAYGEAPGIAGTLLAGGLTSGAFLAILRVYQICVAAGEGEFARRPMIAVGLFSMLVAGVFMARQKDFKRMLAYSSVEHMGILMVGTAVGGAAAFGALLHLVNNGLTKGVLFLSAGNIHSAYGSKTTDDVRGALRRVPLSAALFLAGFFAVTGSPPFGPFLSELTILNGAITRGYYGVAAAFLLMLIVVFVGMGATVVAVVQGEPPESRAARVAEPWATVLPGVALLGLVLLLGVYIPKPLDALLSDAVRTLEVPR